VGRAETDAYAIARLSAWGGPIRLDPKWNQGDYYGKAEPVDGLELAFATVVHEAQGRASVSKTDGRKWAEDGKDPARSWDNSFMAEKTLNGFAKFLAQINDANSFLYQIKANQLFVAGDGQRMDTGLAKVKAKLLILPAQSDLMVLPQYSQEAAEDLRQLGKSVDYHEIPGDGGHLDGIYNIAAVGGLVEAFLKQ
jgi:homoserine O-acetyltransferase/O-succinyltransferase